MIINNIECEALEITGLTSISSHSSIKVIMEISGEIKIEKSYNLPLASTQELEIIGDNLIIKPEFYITGALKFVDGVYSIKVILDNGDETFTIDNNCAFIDCNYTCLINGMILNALASDDKGKKEEGLFMSMALYTLEEGSNCGCNCSEMVALFKKIRVDLLNNSNGKCKC